MGVNLMSNIILLISGVIVFLFAKNITNLMLKNPQLHRFNTPILRTLFYVWPFRFIGVACVLVSLHSLIGGYGYSTDMGKDENRLILLESGKIVKAQVTESYYQTGAPAGWMVCYIFETEDPVTHNNKKFQGLSQGPWKYYKNLSPGDYVEIIYNSLEPKINCEIRCFLNNPSFRNTFKKAGKLHLLNKFKDEHELEDYTFKRWAELLLKK